MSLAGRPSQQPPNGGAGQEVPPDLVWDEENPPSIYQCSQHTSHAPNCDGSCGDPIELDSELQVELMNEGRAWARAGMSFHGIPAAYAEKIPIPGPAIELVDLMMWLQTIKEVVTELAGMNDFEFEEKYREHKLHFLREIRLANEAAIRRQRVANSLGIIEKPPLLGPDGMPV